jgi:hypothetical protein
MIHEDLNENTDNLLFRITSKLSLYQEKAMLPYAVSKLMQELLE